MPSWTAPKEIDELIKRVNADADRILRSNEGSRRLIDQIGQRVESISLTRSPSIDFDRIVADARQEVAEAKDDVDQRDTEMSALHADVKRLTAVVEELTDPARLKTEGRKSSWSLYFGAGGFVVGILGIVIGIIIAN